MKESYEDIRKLLEQFMSAQEAGQMTDDIRQADNLVSSVPAPKVSEETLAAIRGMVHKRLAAGHRQTVRVRMEKYFAAVAAIVLIAVLTFVYFDNNQRSRKNLPQLAARMKIWNDNISTDTELTNQFDQLTGQLDNVNQTATQWLEENSNLTLEVDNLEAIAMNTDFWKG